MDVSEQSARASALATELRTTLGRVKRKLREHGGHNDFTPSQIAVIHRLEQSPSTVSDLARLEGMRPQSMSAIILALQTAGHVEGSSDPNDGRKTLMSLTRKFQKNLQQGRAARQDWLAATIQQKLTPQQQEKVADAVKLLARLIED